MTFINRFAVLLGLALFSAQAQAVEFSFVSGTVTPDAWGNSYSATVDGLTLTASAWAGTGRRDAFETAALSMQSGGLGVCNRDEGLHCDTYSRALDNRGAADLILFRFSRAVGLDTLTLRQAGSDSDLSVWAGSGAIDLNGMARDALGTATMISPAGDDAIRSAALGGPFTGSYDWLAVSARLNQRNDFANLLALSVVPVSQPVPEAGTWAMLLAGLGLIGFVVRRRA
jgi:MYXO-CTERM domain-containing protein